MILRSGLQAPLVLTFYALALSGVVASAAATPPGPEQAVWRFYGLAVALYGLLTLLVLKQRPGDHRATLFMFVGLGVSVSLLFEHPGLAALETPAGTVMLGIYCAVYFLNPAVWLHLVSNIPRPHPFPRLILGGYVVGGLLAGGVYAAYLVTAYGPLPLRGSLEGVLAAHQRLVIAAYATMGVTALFLLGRSARGDATPTGRRQALVVFAALLPWTIHAVALTAVPAMHRLPLDVAEAVAILLIPIGFAASLIGYRMFEVSVVVRRGLIFALAAGVLAAVGYAGLLLADVVLRRVVGAGIPPWGTAAVLVLGGALFPVASRIVAEAVDRRFFPEMVALRRLRRVIIPELAGFTAVEEAAAHLAERLRSSGEVERCALLLMDAGDAFCRPAALAGPFPAGRSDPRHVVVSADDLAAWSTREDAFPIRPGALSAGLRAAVEQLGAVYAAPVRLRERLVGVVLLGPSAHGRPLERDALAQLGDIVRQASAMLENTRLFALATHDSLTGLPQRAVVLERLAREVDRCRRSFHPFAVAFVDVDRFKAINDSRGHQAGDAVLRHVARLLDEGSRHTDHLARYGGEEFLLVMPDTDAAGALRHAEALRQRVASTGVDAGPPGSPPALVTVSIGVCAVSSPPELAPPAELVRAADEALYRAKRAGRDRVECARAAPLPELAPVSAAARRGP